MQEVVIVVVVVAVVVVDIDIAAADDAAAAIVVIVPLLTLAENEWISEIVVDVEGKVDQTPQNGVHEDDADDIEDCIRQAVGDHHVEEPHDDVEVDKVGHFFLFSMIMIMMMIMIAASAVAVADDDDIAYCC